LWGKAGASTSLDDLEAGVSTPLDDLEAGSRKLEVQAKIPRARSAKRTRPVQKPTFSKKSTEKESPFGSSVSIKRIAF
jgi:hypothetical protein